MAVVVAAGESGVGDVGGSAFVPFVDVVGFAAVGWHVTSWPGAVAVTDGEDGFHPLGVEASAASGVDGGVVGAYDDARYVT